MEAMDPPVSGETDAEILGRGGRGDADLEE